MQSISTTRTVHEIATSHLRLGMPRSFWLLMFYLVVGICVRGSLDRNTSTFSSTIPSYERSDTLCRGTLWSNRNGVARRECSLCRNGEPHACLPSTCYISFTLIACGTPWRSPLHRHNTFQTPRPHSETKDINHPPSSDVGWIIFSRSLT